MNLSTLLNNEMQGPEYKILGYLAFLCYLKGKSSPSGAKWAQPSQAKIGEVTGYTRQWVNEKIRHLCELGLITKLRRRKKGDYWPTCLYRLTRLGWQVKGTGRRLWGAVAKHVNSRRHIESSREEELEIKIPADPSLAAKLASWLAGGPGKKEESG